MPGHGDAARIVVFRAFLKDASGSPDAAAAEGPTGRRRCGSGFGALVDA